MLAAAQLFHRPATEPATLDFHHLASEFLERLDRSPETHRSYRATLGNFRSWAANQEPTEDLEALLLAYKAHRLEVVTPATVASNLTALRRFFGWLVKKGHLPENPAADIRPPKQPRGHRRDALTLTEAVRLLDAVDTSTLRGKRELAILSLMVRAGLRDVELHRADVGHLGTVDGQRVLWVHGKGRDEADEFVLLNRKAWEALEAYLATRATANSQRGALQVHPSPSLEPDAPLFVGFDGRCQGRVTTRTIRREVTRALKRVGLKSKRVTAHSLRHTAATLAIQAGACLSQVQAMMRHADPRTTARYVHLHDRVTNGAERTLNF